MTTSSKKFEGFTPGPWKNHPLCSRLASVFRGRAIKDGSGKTLIARTYEELKGGVHPKHNEAEANARLIAAAPEMLELLWDIYETAFVDQEHSPLAKRTETLIQKIKGNP